MRSGQVPAPNAGIPPIHPAPPHRPNYSNLYADLVEADRAGQLSYRRPELGLTRDEVLGLLGIAHNKQDGAEAVLTYAREDAERAARVSSHIQWCIGRVDV